jgi:hypothetical protein
MIKNNIFYLFLVAIFLILSVLSFYWFNNVDSYTNTYNTEEDVIFKKSVDVWYKFNAILSFLDIFDNDSKSQNDNKNISALDNPIEKGVKLASTLEIEEEIKNKSEEQTATTKSINNIIEEKRIKEKEWYKNSDNWLSKKGFYASKSDNVLELGWQSSQGKTYSINIPY